MREAEQRKEEGGDRIERERTKVVAKDGGSTGKINREKKDEKRTREEGGGG